MKTKPSTEYVFMQFLESALESTWQVSTSQLYVLLKRLEYNGLLESNLGMQETRPSKRVFALTSKGKKTFLEWLQSPVKHIRDLRIEFLAKLFFLQSFSLKGGNELIKAQISSLEDVKGKLQKKNKIESEAFRKLVFEIKLMTIETWQEWLQKKAKPFMRKVRTHG
jgi:PadR family transcriptional regulator AphA